MSNFEEKLDNINITDDDLIIQIDREYYNAIQYRNARIKDWHANEDMLFGKKQPTLNNRSNINLHLMKGFEDTLISKIKNPPIAKFNPTEEADGRKAKKVTALWELESSPVKQNWRYKDLLSKILALPSGRAIMKSYATSKPYKHHLDIVDHYDFLIDPMAGGYDIELARYCGQDNIFKSKYELLNNPKYRKNKVKELIDSYSESPEPQVDNQFREKQNRYAIIGLDLQNYNYAGDGLYKLLEWYTTVEGQRMYVVLSLEKKIILTRKLLSDVISPLEEGEPSPYPFDTWAYYPHPFIFWTPSPMDVVRENFQAQQVAVQQGVDNNEQKNKPMTFYDAGAVKDPTKLNWRPDGKVAVAKGTDPSRAIFKPTVPDLFDPVQLRNLLKDIASDVTGVTPGAQGNETQDTKVGIYYGNQQVIADRMSTFGESYSMAINRRAQLYLIGIKDHLDEAKAVKMIGPDGVEWDKIRKEDLTEFDITISGGSIEAQNDALKAKNKADFIARNQQNPIFNQKVLAEQDAILAGFDPQDVKRLLEQEEVNADLMSQAAEDIQKLLEGEKVDANLKANTQYAQKILDFMMNNEMRPDQDARFIAYLDELKPIIIRNMVMKAQTEMALKGALPTPDGIAPAQGNMNQGGPMPNTPGATISQASQITNNIKPQYVQ